MEIVHADQNVVITKGAPKKADIVKDTPNNFVVHFSDIKEAYPDIADEIKKDIFNDKDIISVIDIKKAIKSFKPNEEVSVAVKSKKRNSETLIYLDLSYSDVIAAKIKADPLLADFFVKYARLRNDHPSYTSRMERGNKPNLPRLLATMTLKNRGSHGYLIDRVKSFISEALSHTTKTEYSEEELQKLRQFIDTNFSDTVQKLVSTAIQYVRKKGGKSLTAKSDPSLSKFGFKQGATGYSTKVIAQVSLADLVKDKYEVLV